MERLFTTDRGDAGRRVDTVVLRHLADMPAISRTRVQAWIDEGCVLVAGCAARKPSSRVRAGVPVQVRIGEPRVRRVPRGEDLPLDVLFEDEYLLAINKAAGVVAHPSYKHESGTVLNALLWRARTWGGNTRPSLVHRLDKDTSGVLLVAKTRSVHAALQRAMRGGRVEKHYLAVVHGRPRPARGRIDLPLARDLHDRRRVVATGIGRASVTEYDRVETAGTGRGSISLVRCRLLTGRMHQIRVHLAARGWPIVGDATYGAGARLGVDDRTRRDHPAPGMARHALHAERLALTHPVTAAPLVIEAPLPADMRALVAWIESAARTFAAAR